MSSWAQEQWGSGRARSTLPAVQKKKKKKAAIATECCRGCQAFIASSIAGGAIMHSSTNGFPLRSHFVYWLHWKVIPKQPGINHRRLAEMPLLLSPSGQYTVCRYGGHTVRVLSFFFFFFSSFCFLLVLYVLIPLNVGPFFFIFFFPRLQLVPSVILVCASPCIIMGGGKNSASSIADL